MPYAPPTPQEISDRLSAGFESAFRDVTPEGVDATSANAPFGVLADVLAQGLYGNHLHLGTLARDFFVDTCDASLVPRHAARWGLSQIPAEPAAGTVQFAGADGTALPAGIILTAPSGALYTTQASVTIAGGTASVPVEAEEPGAAGNQPAGTVLQLVSPVAGLSAQSATVDAQGLSGGFDTETLEALRSRTIARIRRRSRGGGPGDYEDWVRNIDPNVGWVAEKPLWVGLGSVGVVVAMRPGRAPTEVELDRIEAGLAAVRPIAVRQLVVLPAVIRPVDLVLRVTPDTTAVRAAVAEAFALFLAAEPGIGGTIDWMRLNAALSSAAGQYSHRMPSPAADIVLGATELAVPGTIAWEPWS